MSSAPVLFVSPGSTTACHLPSRYRIQLLSGFGRQVGNPWPSALPVPLSFHVTDGVSVTFDVEGSETVMVRRYSNVCLSGRSPPFHVAVATSFGAGCPSAVLNVNFADTSWPVVVSVTFWPVTLYAMPFGSIASWTTILLPPTPVPVEITVSFDMPSALVPCSTFFVGGAGGVSGGFGWYLSSTMMIRFGVAPARAMLSYAILSTLVDGSSSNGVEVPYSCVPA